jgi:hypothetical protein
MTKYAPIRWSPKNHVGLGRDIHFDGNVSAYGLKVPAAVRHEVANCHRNGILKTEAMHAERFPKPRLTVAVVCHTPRLHFGRAEFSATSSA